MVSINRNAFISELSKLLTFMYDDDRRLAISMYERMFDEISDEQKLIQRLMSPTRQAVVIARVYDAKSKSLQVHAEQRSSTSVNEHPKFVEVIEKIEADALAEQEEEAAAQVEEGQLSLFDTPEDSVSSAPAAETEKTAETVKPVKSAAPPAPASDSFEPVADVVPSSAEAAVSAAEAAGPAAEASLPAAEVNAADAAAESKEDIAAPADEKSEADVDAFMEDFSIEPKTEDLKPGIEVPKAVAESDFFDDPVEMKKRSREPIRKPRIFLLILYIIFAVPITLALVILLLIPTLASLGLAAAAICTGAVTLTAAFCGFAVFADIMVVLGSSIVILALGLLFLWLFIWFIGGAIVGVIRGAINLGRKWCYKEVEA